MYFIDRHRETSHIRVLMRQEKTMKIIVNHFLDPRIVITPNAGSADTSWVWVAFDFSDGIALVETVCTSFFVSQIFVLFSYTVLLDFRHPFQDR